VDFVPRTQPNKTSNVVVAEPQQNPDNVEVKKDTDVTASSASTLFGNYHPRPELGQESASSQVDRSSQDSSVPEVPYYRPYRPREGHHHERPAVWRPRWSTAHQAQNAESLSGVEGQLGDVGTGDSRAPPSWFPSSTSRSTSYKNFGFPVFSVKSRPPKQTGKNQIFLICS
jgi:hypothetical protein